MKVKAYIHVGLPKTGTSTIQASSVLYHKELLEQGLDYPIENLTKNRHQYFIPALLKRNFQYVHSVLERKQKEGNELLFSTEGFTNHLEYFSQLALGDFKSLFDAYKTIGVLFVREIESWSKSYYKQIVINPPNNSFYATSLTFSEFIKIPEFQFFLNKERIIQSVKDKFGFDELVVLQYEKDWVQQLPELFSKYPENTFNRMRVNTSRSESVIELIRQINGLSLSLKLRQPLVQALVQYDIAKSDRSFDPMTQRTDGEALKKQADLVLNAGHPEMANSIHKWMSTAINFAQ